MATVFNWTLCPARLVETSIRKAYQTGSDLGHSRGRQVNQRELRQWELTYDSLDLILDEVERAWSATKGPVLSLSYTPPGGSALEVRFASNTLERVRRSTSTGSCTIVLEEVR